MEQELIAFKSPLTIRFTAANGVVTDTLTGLQWAAKDNGKKINWHDARAYCQNYSGGGYNDWRLPTASELEGLYRAGIRDRSGDIINITDDRSWASENRSCKALGSPKGAIEAACFNFFLDSRSWGDQSSSYTYRALPVRSGK